MASQYRRQVLSALSWSVSGDIAAQIIRAGFGVALARLLSPREFGLLAMLTIVTQFVAANADAGFEDALVQKPELSEAHRSSVFWAMMLIGGALTLALATAAPWFARFYDVPELRPLALALSPLFLLGAAGVVPRALLARRLDFRRPAALGCVAAAVAGVGAVMLAVRGFGVLSLAAQLLLTEAIETVLLFRACGWRPRDRFSMAALYDLFGFSAYRPLARTLGYWARNLDQLLIGKLLGSEQLGLYARAYGLARAPVVYVSRSIVAVMFPSLAKIQHDTARVRAVFLRTTGAVALATFPLCIGLAVSAEPLVVGALGEAWRDTIPALQLLSLAALVQSISTLSGVLYLSQGRPDLHLRVTALQRIATMAAIVAAVRWGLRGVAAAQVVAAVVSAVPTLTFAGELVGLRLRTLLASLWRVLLASLVMAGAVLAARFWVGERLPPLALLAFEAALGGLTYWSAVRALHVAAYHDVLTVLRQMLRPVAGGDGERADA
ncbi:MAG: lipopolysaccharide biosynthesis protein [Candidatus Binatia bacterium]